MPEKIHHLVHMQVINWHYLDTMKHDGILSPISQHYKLLIWPRGVLILLNFLEWFWLNVFYVLPGWEIFWRGFLSNMQLVHLKMIFYLPRGCWIFDILWGFCIICDIFSNRILFSLSISVNLTISTKDHELIFVYISETVDLKI